MQPTRGNPLVLECRIPGYHDSPWKIAILKWVGYNLLGYFPLSSSHCTNNEYKPIKEHIPAFLQWHADLPKVAQLIQMEWQEAKLYECHCEGFNYKFYIACKCWYDETKSIIHLEEDHMNQHAKTQMMGLAVPLEVGWVAGRSEGIPSLMWGWH